MSMICEQIGEKLVCHAGFVNPNSWFIVGGFIVITTILISIIVWRFTR